MPIRNVIEPVNMAIRGWAVPVASNPIPAKRNPKAVLYCIGTNAGFTCIRSGLCVYQPNSTTIPNNRDSPPEKIMPINETEYLKNIFVGFVYLWMTEF